MHTSSLLLDKIWNDFLFANASKTSKTAIFSFKINLNCWRLSSTLKHYRTLSNYTKITELTRKPHSPITDLWFFYHFQALTALFNVIFTLKNRTNTEKTQ